MVSFRTIDEIALAMIDLLRLTRPELDTKPGSVARDVFVDPAATEFSKLYNELRNISNLQSLASSIGTDLDRLARNFGLTRNTGSAASGTVWFTTNDLTSDVFIPSGSLVLSQGGQTFSVLVDTAFESTKSNVYRSNALRIRSELDLAGITDEFALEAAVEATAFGTAGNVGKFGVNQTSISGVSNVTNVNAMTGGAGAETDAAFRARALGIFAGSNIGTTLGYINALLADPRVSDVLAVEPGDPLMVRDGTQTGTSTAGDTIVVSSGTGGKVDLYIQGTSLESFSESYIYRDQSGRGDPTDSSNDFVLGQRDINPFLDFQQKRKLLIEAGTLPLQPVDSIVSVSGSLSGPNFIQKFTDEEGQEQGSYELIKDTDAFGGSPFGFDRISWINNQITLPDETGSKGPFNGQDALDFTNVTNISKVNQQVSITNENSAVNSTNRSIITLTHTPVVTTTRVDNLSTGERYTIANQNVDNGTTNTTGRVQISGGTLPTSSDILQVNYIWDLSFDENIDYDDLQSTVFTRTVQDSVDWGFANRVEAEEEDIVWSAEDGYHIIVEHPISRVVDVLRVKEETRTNVSGKLTVSNTIINIQSVKDVEGREVFYTAASNGSFSGKEITLPTDTVLLNGETAIIRYNTEDLFSPDGYEAGTFSGNLIKFDEGAVVPGETVFANYIANIPTLLPTTAITNLPALGDENNFIVNSNVVGNQPVSNEYSVGGNITRNLRFSPSYLRILVQGTSAVGRLTVKGIAHTRVEALFVSTRDGLTIDLNQAIRDHFGISSIPVTMFVSDIDSVENVTVADNQVSSVDYAFDTLNVEIKNTSYSNGRAITNASLNTTQFSLSATQANLDQQPTTGQWVRVVFYVANTNTTENITISAGGTHITDNKYVFVDSITASSGFISVSGTVDGTISVSPFTQPTDGSTYFTTYSYTAPKEGERIIVNYNFNRLINDSTFTIEDVRPVTADVLVKAAGTIGVDVSLLVVAIPNFTQSDEVLRQSVQETVTSFITSGGLDATIDASDIINVVYSVDGVDRVEITTFNETGNTGVVRSLVSGRDKYFVAGIIEATIEER